MTLVPMYERDYKTKKEVLAAFNADKDFLIQDMSSLYNGKLINRSQLCKGVTVSIRYNHLHRLVVVKL